MWARPSAAASSTASSIPIRGAISGLMAGCWGVINLGIPSDSVIGLAPGLNRGATALVQHDGNAGGRAPHLRLGTGETRQPSRRSTPDGRASCGHGLRHALDRDGAGPAGPPASMPSPALPLLTVMKPALWGIGGGFLALAVLSLRAASTCHSWRRRRAGEVEQALADNKVLFQEVHHRVKNNLQVISSLHPAADRPSAEGDGAADGRDGGPRARHRAGA